MMVFTLFIIGLALFTGVILNTALEEFRHKADMSIYFTTDAPEAAILELQSALSALPEVESIDYTSREVALAEFRERHQNDQLTLQALEELGENPLGAVLNVKAHNITQYDAIASFLEENNAALVAGGSQIIEKINYYDEQHRQAIERLAQITDSARLVGAAVIALFVAVTIAICFNTLRLAIYTSREEISVMRLVGATGGYIRAPFVIEGILYGLVAGAITLMLFYPLTWWLGDATVGFFGGVNVFYYYITNFGFFFLVIVGSGVALGAIASALAVRRYLKV
jgi:cell division transport system permease protein